MSKNIQFSKHISLLRLRALVNMNPESASKLLASQCHLAPVSSTLGVSFVSGGTPERKTQTNDETSHGKQNASDTEIYPVVLFCQIGDHS